MPASGNSTDQWTPKGFSSTNGQDDGQPREGPLSVLDSRHPISAAFKSPKNSSNIDFLDCSNPDAKKSTDDNYCDPNSKDKSRGLTGKAREIACSIREEENVVRSNGTGEPFFCSLQRFGVQAPNYDYTCYGLFNSSCLINRDNEASAGDKKAPPINSPCSCRTKYFFKKPKSLMSSTETSDNQTNCDILYECICNPNKSFHLISEASMDQAEGLIETLNSNSHFSTSAYRIECHSIFPRESGDLAYCFLKKDAFSFENRLDCTHYNSKSEETSAEEPSSVVSDIRHFSPHSFHQVGNFGDSIMGNFGDSPLGTALQNVGIPAFLFGLILVVLYTIFRWRRN